MTETDVELLHAAVVVNPLDDTPRLIYADALDERNGPGDADRARFVRLQIELAGIGPARVVLGNSILVERGPDYYEVDVTDDDGAFAVGQRIDVVGEPLDKIRSGSRNKRYHGLLVTKVMPDAYLDYSGRLALKRDEHSKPYPRKRATELAAAVHGIANGHWREWVPDCMNWRWPQFQCVGAGAVELAESGRRHAVDAWQRMILTVERGFVSAVRGEWREWLAYGDALTAACPVCRVDLYDDPVWDATDRGVWFPGDPKSETLLWGRVVGGTAFAGSRVDFVGDHLPLFLHARWPSIPADNWTLPNDD